MIYDWAASGKRIKELREARGMTQNELSEELGIHEKTLSKAERGKIGLSVDNLLLVSEYFETTMDYLVIGSFQNEVNERLFALVIKMSAEQQEAACKILEGIKAFVAQ